MRMTIRDVRLHWPKAEEALNQGGEVVVTRDGKPVARLLPYLDPVRRRARFKSERHLHWLSGFWKGKAVGPSSGELLDSERQERKENKERKENP
jgi:antitoxin (DNA-binding transcriptional repressor) of toxin-antitoxin stability system